MCRWEDVIKINLTEIGKDSVDWIHVAEESGKWKATVNPVLKI